MPLLDPHADGPVSTPDYDAHQRAFHAAFRVELARILDTLGVRPGDDLLDAPCGGGFYAEHLASRGARVTALDANAAYLAEARRRLGGLARVVDGDVYALPLADESQDWVLCAQSLISLEDLPRAFGEFRRVLRPGGTLAVLEADALHHLILPWPVEVEAAVQAAKARANLARHGDAAKTSPVRRLRAQLLAAGFPAPLRRTHAADFAGPFPLELAEFLLLDALALREFVADEVPGETRAAFDRLTRPDSPEALFRRPDADLTLLNVLTTARRPALA